MKTPGPGSATVFPALAAGALLPLSFAPFDVWPAAIAALAIAFWVMRDADGWRDGFFRGWLIGVGKYGAGASWVYVSIHEQGGASESLAGVLVGVFVAGMALFSGLFGLLYGWANRSAPAGARSVSWAQVLLFAACWTLAEWSLTWLLTGFPWLFAGYGLTQSWLAGFVPLVGVLGLGFIGCLLGAALLMLVPQTSAGRPARVLAVGMWLITPGAGFGLQQVEWVELGEAREVALVQGNIDQLSKWDPANRLPIISTYETLTEPHWDARLIIWPEAAITLFANQAAPWLQRWDTRGQATGSTLVLGVPDFERTAAQQPAFQNTALALGAGSGQYVKQRLVPFGEYVPLESVLRGVIEFFDLPMSRSSSGPADQPLMVAGGVSLGMAICYEIAYPELVRASAIQADALVTISNDAWFGASIGPHQHLQIARMRALENGRYVLRGTNNGVTAIIDERGTLQASLPQFEPGVLRGEFRPASGRTPFGYTGHWPVLLAAAGVFISILCGITGRKRGAKLPAA